MSPLVLAAIATIYPGTRFAAAATVVPLLAAEPLVAWHERNMTTRTNKRKQITERRVIDSMAVELPHKVEGRMAKAVDATQASIVRALQLEQMIDVYPNGSRMALRFRRYYFVVQSQSVYFHIDRVQPAIERSLGLGANRPVVIFQSVPGELGLAVDVGLPESEWNNPTVDAVLTAHPRTRLELPLGLDPISQEFRAIDVVQEDMALVLVGGMSGSGKTQYLRSIVRFHTHYYPPEISQLMLCDLKSPNGSAAYQEFADNPNVIDNRIYTTPEQVLEALDWLEQERMRRENLWSENGVLDIHQYREQIANLPEIFCIIDEPGEIPSSERKPVSKLTYAFEQRIERLGKKGRSAGIHLILGYQRTSKDDIHPSVRSNATHNLAFKVRSPRDAALILGEEPNEQGNFPQSSTAAASLSGKGEFIFNGERFQAFYTPPTVAMSQRPQLAPQQPLESLPAAAETTSEASAPDYLEKYQQFRQFIKDGGTINQFIEEKLGEKSKGKHAQYKEALRALVKKYGLDDTKHYVEWHKTMFHDKLPSSTDLAHHLFGSSIKNAGANGSQPYVDVAQYLLNQLS